MKSFVPEFEIVSPKTINQALSILNNEGKDLALLAGGTDLMVLFHQGRVNKKKFLNLVNIQGLRGIEVKNDFVEIGALTTFAELQRNQVLKTEFPVLVQAAQTIGSWAIQNRATLAGNIVNGSPAAALLIYDAKLELRSLNGSRTLEYNLFHKAYKKMDLRPDEILTKIQLPRASFENCHTYFRKVGTRSAQAISKVCFAGLLCMQQQKIKHIRLALGSVAPFPLRLIKTESLLLEQVLSKKLVEAAIRDLQHEISPIDDIRSTKEYRMKVARNLLEDFLVGLA